MEVKILPLSVTIPRPLVAASSAQISIINDSSIPICYSVDCLGNVRGQHNNMIGNKFYSVQPAKIAFVGAREVATVFVALKCVFMAPDVSQIRVRWCFAPGINTSCDAARWFNKSHLKAVKHVDIGVCYENSNDPIKNSQSNSRLHPPPPCLRPPSSSSFFANDHPWFNAFPRAFQVPEEDPALFPNPFGLYDKYKQQHQAPKIMPEVPPLPPTPPFPVVQQTLPQPKPFQAFPYQLQSQMQQTQKSQQSPAGSFSALLNRAESSPAEEESRWANIQEEEEDGEDGEAYLGGSEDVENNSQNINFMDWGIAEVCQWLVHIGLREYIGTFSDNDIDGKALASITDDFVTALGIENEMEKGIFIKELNALKAKPNDSSMELVEEGEITTNTETTKGNPTKGDEDIPSEFYDAISFELMRDPVFTCDGHTYERQSISLWLESHNTSPITGLPLENKKLVPNFALKSLLQRYLK